mgnify:CR=1 FL=1
MKKFNKRTYNNISEFIDDIKFFIKNRDKIKKLHKEQLLNKDFQERLMVAVTGVNDCRYCTYYHTRLALETGITSEEIDNLLEGTFEDSPDNEKIALLYAQHWADQNGSPDMDYKEELIECYGLEKSQLINLTIRTINFGNLMGNTLDYFLYKLTFGLLGKP